MAEASGAVDDADEGLEKAGDGMGEANLQLVEGKQLLHTRGCNWWISAVGEGQISLPWIVCVGWWWWGGWVRSDNYV